MKCFFAIALFILATSMSRSFDNQSSLHHYDGKWWLAQEVIEQQGFINGANDCRVWERKGKIQNPKPVAEEQSLVTEYYKTQTSKSDRSVFDVLSDADKSPSKNPQPKGGEVWKEPHGYFDGQWWREAEPKERRGFLEGYLACYTQDAKQKKGKFSGSPDNYLASVNNWYGLKEDDRSVNPKREDKKIANVLFLFIEK